MPTPYNPSWTPPNYTDNSVAGEHTAGKINQIIAIVQNVIEWIGFARQNIFNVEEYGAIGNGIVHCSVAINEALSLAKLRGGVCEVPPGEFLCTETLKVPAVVRLQGGNRRTAILTASGEFNLIEVESKGGAVQIEQLFLKCAAPQTTKGAAIALANEVLNVEITMMYIGSNFYDVFNCGKECSYVDISHIVGSEYNGQLKSIGKAFFVWGDKVTASRAYNSSVTQVFAVAATQKDVPKWFEIRNTDSLKVTNSQFQNGTVGMRCGEGDTSALGTTNLSCDGVQFDGGSEGMQCFVIQRVLYSDFANCHAQGGLPGVLVSGEVSGTTWTGGQVYRNYTCGFVFQPSASPSYSFTITGTMIANNGFLKKAVKSESSGVYIEKDAGGITITGCQIGNFGLIAGTATQNWGVTIQKSASVKRRNITITGNRVPEVGTGKPETLAGSENLTKGIENEEAGTEAENGILIANNNSR